LNRSILQRAPLRALLRRTHSIVVLLLLAACATLPASSTTIIKSPNDHREYRAIDLPNGLIGLIVSDPTTDKAAAALAVYRGSYDDPEGREGLAHFLEHMLFLGTTKYPDVDDYQNYITTHGGTFNAYTASDHTNYFFDIQPSYLEGGLDRFAQFFIAPTFDAAYVEREKNAVNSEYQLYLKDDDWRAGAVEKQVMSQTHPGARFSVGSLDTLSGDVRTDLVEFYRTHYSADQMALVVIGNQSLDELGAWVTAKFSAIPRRPIAKPAPMGPMFAPGTLPRKLTYQTVKDTRQLTYNFPVPALDRYFREKPGSYVANLLGHEGVGSLHAQLKARGWIESLGASAQRFDADNALVMVSIELTEEGAAHVDDITNALFDEIALIRAKGVDKWRYEEQAKVAGLAFRFQEPSSPMSFVYTTAPNLRLYPVKDVLEAPYLMEHYDEALIRRYLDALRPDNLLLEVSGQKVDADKIEPWFQVPYRDQKLTTTLSGTPEEFGLALPSANEFLPTDLKLETQPQSIPKSLDSTPSLALWWAPDASFGAPRATTYVRLDVAGGFRTPNDSAYANLYARLVLDALNTFAYPAEVAGLDYGIEVQSSGFLITVSGYNDKQPLLLNRILDVFANIAPSQEKVADYREELRRSWQNFVAGRPYEQAMASVSHVMIAGGWPPAQLSGALADVTPVSLDAWRSARLNHYGALVLMHGNVSSDEATRIARIVKTTLRLEPVDATANIVARLPMGDFTYPLTIDNADSAMVMYLQGADTSFAERARFGLASQVLRSAYYNELRTEQQLGYAVVVTPSVLRRVPGMLFVVQSPVAGPNKVLDATLTFLTHYRGELAAMSGEEFTAYKQGLIGRLREKDKNLADRSQRYWSDLDVGFTAFDSREQIARQIEQIDQPQLLAFYDHLLAMAKQRRLVIYSRGRFDDVPPGTPITDVGAFRQAAGFVPSGHAP
jgi:secreted Zn-dependent insulinase-like peptidase